jgi:hypothetical protein
MDMTKYSKEVGNERDVEREKRQVETGDAK